MSSKLECLSLAGTTALIEYLQAKLLPLPHQWVAPSLDHKY